MQIAGITEEDKYLQLVEECGELIQALAKQKRVREGRNYTPVTEEEADEAVTEEIADVIAVMMAILDEDVMYLFNEVHQDDVQKRVDARETALIYSAAKNIRSATAVIMEPLDKKREKKEMHWFRDSWELVLIIKCYCMQNEISLKEIKGRAAGKILRWKDRQEALLNV